MNGVISFCVNNYHQMLSSCLNFLENGAEASKFDTSYVKNPPSVSTYHLKLFVAELFVCQKTKAVKMNKLSLPFSLISPQRTTLFLLYTPRITSHRSDSWTGFQIRIPFVCQATAPTNRAIRRSIDAFSPKLISLFSLRLFCRKIFSYRGRTFPVISN